MAVTNGAKVFVNGFLHHDYTGTDADSDGMDAAEEFLLKELTLLGSRLRFELRGSKGSHPG